MARRKRLRANNLFKVVGIGLLSLAILASTVMAMSSGSLDPRSLAKMVGDQEVSKKAVKTTTETKSAAKGTSKSNEQVKAKTEAKSLTKKITEPVKNAAKAVTKAVSKSTSKPATPTKSKPSPPPPGAVRPQVITVLDPDEFVASLGDGGEQAVAPYAYTPQVAGVPTDEADVYFSDTLNTSGGESNEDLVVSLGYEWQDSNSVDYHTTISLWNDPDFVADYQNVDHTANRQNLTNMVDPSLFPQAAPQTLSVTQAEDGTLKLEFVIDAEDDHTYLVNVKIKDADIDTPEELQATIHQLTNASLIVADSLTTTTPANLTMIQQITTSTTTIFGNLISFLTNLLPL